VGTDRIGNADAVDGRGGGLTLMPFANWRPFTFRTDENEISPTAPSECFEFLRRVEGAEVDFVNRSLLLPDMQ
jgi:hypothetical protein